MPKRLFILGSGPSLRNAPLDRLHEAGEHTLACNKINLLWEEGLVRHWRPTYYFMADYDGQNGKNWKEWVLANAACKHLWLWDGFRDGFPPGHSSHEILPDGLGELPKTTWLARCPRHHYYQPANPRMAGWGWHLPEICTGVNSISAMLQIGALLGYDELYLLGCDLGYTPDRALNHFSPNYSLFPFDKAATDNRNYLAAHKVANRDCPVPIYNATPGGMLEVYPRVDLETLL